MAATLVEEVAAVATPAAEPRRGGSCDRVGKAGVAAGVRESCVRSGEGPLGGGCSGTFGAGWGQEGPEWRDSRCMVWDLYSSCSLRWLLLLLSVEWWC